MKALETVSTASNGSSLAGGERVPEDPPQEDDSVAALDVAGTILLPLRALQAQASTPLARSASSGTDERVFTLHFMPLKTTRYMW